MTRPPPASGDQVPARPSPSPHNPTAAHTQDNRAERAALLRDFIGEALTVVTHCKQIAAVTREAFAIVKTIGEADVAA